MADCRSPDARVERVEFGKTQQGDPFFKVVKLVRGRPREYWFPLRDYKLARDEIVAVLNVGEERSPESVWNLFEYAVETARPKLSFPTRPGLHEDCFVLPNGRVLGLAPWRVFLPSADGSRIGLFDDEGDVGEWEAIPDLAHGNSLLTKDGLINIALDDRPSWDRGAARLIRRRSDLPVGATTARWHLDEMVVNDCRSAVLALARGRRRRRGPRRWCKEAARTKARSRKTDAQAPQETGLRAQCAGDRQAAFIRRGKVRDRIVGAP